MELAGFEVLGTIGQGGAGAVLKARRRDGSVVALKLLKTLTAEKLARFEREARLQGGLGASEGFVPLLEAHLGETPAFLVLPFLSGGTLRSRLLGGPLGIEESVSLVRRLAQATGRIHARGILHRDLKPENILFDENGAPLVADLGLAKHFDRTLPGGSASWSFSVEGAIYGTFGYMAPEQCRGSPDVGPPADVFALGAILFECLTGSPPFEGDNVGAVIARTVTGERAAVRALRPDCPEWLAAVVDRALSVDPFARFPEGSTLAAALGASTSASRGRGLAVGLFLGAALTALVAAGLGRGSSGATPTPVGTPTPAGTRTPAGTPTPAPTGTRTPAGTPTPVATVGTASLGWHGEPLLPSLKRDLAYAKSYRYAIPGTAPIGSEITLELVYVPPGAYRLGDRAKPRTVSLAKGFYMARGPITWSQYLFHFAKARPERKLTLPSWIDPTVKVEGRPDYYQHPVVTVTWSDARAFCEWARLRLPTEDEWECAARGPAGDVYPWGDEWRRAFVNIAGEGDAYPYTSPAKKLAGHGKPERPTDMAGNVWQWCSDPATLAGKPHARAIRGGSWRTGPAECVSSHRAARDEDERADDQGFRPVLDAP